MATMRVSILSSIILLCRQRHDCNTQLHAEYSNELTRHKIKQHSDPSIIATTTKCLDPITNKRHIYKCCLLKSAYK
jgi:hypothetical protein